MSRPSSGSSPCAKAVTPRSFKVRLKVLTPIHIGSGEKLNRLDYFYADGQFCRVDMDGLFRDPNFADQQDRFLEAAPNGQAIDDLLGANGLHREHVLYRIPVDESARACRESEVSTFIKSAGRVYIPGSSLKGAILSALVWKVLADGWNSEDAERRTNARRDIRRLLKDGFFPFEESDGSEGRLGLMDAVLCRLARRACYGPGLRAFTQWLQVSDSGFAGPDGCLGLLLADVKGSSRGLRLLYEAVQKDTEFTFTLKLPKDSTLTAKRLLEAVNEFYRKVKDKDKLAGDDTSMLPASGCLIRLGAGSGLFATSLLLFAQDKRLVPDVYKVPDKRVDSSVGPRSRKRVGAGNIPLGWAQLEVETG